MKNEIFLGISFFLYTSIDGICRDIKNPPNGLYPFHKQLEGTNIYGDSETASSLVGVSYEKDMDGQEDSALKFTGDELSYVEIPRHETLDTARDISIVLSIFPKGKFKLLLWVHGLKVVQVFMGSNCFHGFIDY